MAESSGDNTKIRELKVAQECEGTDVWMLVFHCEGLWGSIRRLIGSGRDWKTIWGRKTPSDVLNESNYSTWLVGQGQEDLAELHSILRRFCGLLWGELSLIQNTFESLHFEDSEKGASKVPASIT